VLGPLQTIIDKHRQQREEAANRAYTQRTAEGLAGATVEDFEPSRQLSAPTAYDTLYLANCHMGDTETSRRYTLRVIKKKAVDKATQQKVIEEMRILNDVNPNVAVPTLLAAFSDTSRLFAVFSQVLTVELRELIDERLAEADARFYLAVVLTGLQNLHLQDIVYRSLSLDGLVLGSNGYPQLVDFSCCKDIAAEGRTYTLCGTPDYLAPEQVAQKGHGTEADFWAVGVLGYEMLTGSSPWGSGLAEMAIYKAISEHKGGAELSFGEAKSSLSSEARSFICELLEPKEDERLGCSPANGVEDIENHPWFDGYDFDGLLSGSILSPHAKACQAWLDEEVTPPADFEAPAYHGGNKWCEDWDYLCSVGSTVEDTKGVNTSSASVLRRTSLSGGK